MFHLLYLMVDVPRVDLAYETKPPAYDERRQYPHAVLGHKRTAEGLARIHLRYLNVTILMVHPAENGPNAVAVGAVPFGNENHL